MDRRAQASGRGRRRLGRVAVACAIAAAAIGLGAAGAPATAKRPVTDTYHGIAVVDDYRWLENWDDPAVKRWSDEQNAFARSVLDRLPAVDRIRARITELDTLQVGYDHLTPIGRRWLALKRDRARDQAAIVTFDDPTSRTQDRVLIDPIRIDVKGTTTIDWFVPSPDGQLIAVSLSQGGSEQGDVHIFDSSSGKDLNDTVPRVNGGTAGGSLTWAADSSGFYYTRYPRRGERAEADLDFYTQVYFHRRRSRTATDRYEIGEGFPRIAEIVLRLSPDGRFVFANVANGDGGEFVQYLRAPDGHWTQLTKYEDKVVFGAFGPDGALYLLSRKDAPHGRVLRVPLANGAARMSAAIVVVPESSDSVIELTAGGVLPFVVTRDGVTVVETVGGPHRLRRFSLDGRLVGTISTPDVSSILELVAAPDQSVWCNVMSYVNRGQWFSVRAGAMGPEIGATLIEARSSETVAPFADMEVTRESVRSRDGTIVPMSIVRRRGLSRATPSPTILIGYGGYGTTYGPFHFPASGLLLEHGGTFVVANIRGGGEFGEAWHLAGNLTNKQNVFDDFLATAEHLIAAGYTSRDKLAILGGSNGGLLMGAALTQRPDLFKAVVSYVGIYDMLRVELSPNGSFNVPEFGTVTNPDHFKAMFAYSPYHRVTDGTRYPPTLMLTGQNDPRVDPMQSRKMVARLQAAAPDSTILLRTSASAGHGFGTSLSELIEQDVDVYAFLTNALGVDLSR